MTSKSTIRARLYYWNTHRPPTGYNQGRYMPGADGKNYRQDCSGYVSMLTGMTASPATAAMASSTSIARRISKGDLTFGDVLLVPPRNGRGGHVVMFDHWTDASHSSYFGHDFGYGSEPHHRTLPYPYGDGRDFQPYRLTAVDQGAEPTPAKPAPSQPPADAPKIPNKPTNTNAAPPYPGLVKSGSKGAAVKAVQARLIARGWKSVGAADGVAGPKTIAAIRAFQQEKGLTVDSQSGPKTWAALWTAPVT